VRKIKVRLPATMTDFGPGLRTLGLALSLYTHVDFSPRTDDNLIVETEGEGAGKYALGLRHPVVLGMMRVFQAQEQAPIGVTIRIKNEIPLDSGLGAEEAFMTAGIIGANNLLDSPYNRVQLIQMAASATKRPDHAITTISGGLTAHTYAGEDVVYRQLALAPFKLIVAVCTDNEYTKPPLPDRVPMEAMLKSLHSLPVLIDALGTGDLKTIMAAVQHGILVEGVQRRIGGYAHVAEVARLAGALGVTTSGGGPAMVFIAEEHHNRIAEAIETAFKNIQIPARVFVLPMDTQGLVLSMMQSS
jgi:homoserine kinase